MCAQLTIALAPQQAFRAADDRNPRIVQPLVLHSLFGVDQSQPAPIEREAFPRGEIDVARIVLLSDPDRASVTRNRVANGVAQLQRYSAFGQRYTDLGGTSGR